MPNPASSHPGIRIFRRVRLFSLILLLPVLLGGLAAFILLNTAFSNINAYGTVPVPGSATLQLPQGSVDLTFATNSPGGQGGSFFIPSMSVSISSAAGGAALKVTQVNGGANTIGSQTRSAVARVEVPAAGAYRVNVNGDASAYINPELMLGHSAPDLLVVELAGGALIFLILSALICGRCIGVFERRAGRARAGSLDGFAGGFTSPGDLTSPGGFTSPGGANSAATSVVLDNLLAARHTVLASDPVDQLSKLAELHTSGALTDAEFAAEKAKIIGT